MVPASVMRESCSVSGSHFQISRGGSAAPASWGSGAAPQLLLLFGSVAAPLLLASCAVVGISNQNPVRGDRDALAPASRKCRPGGTWVMPRNVDGGMNGWRSMVRKALGGKDTIRMVGVG